MYEYHITSKAWNKLMHSLNGNINSLLLADLSIDPTYIRLADNEHRLYRLISAFDIVNEEGIWDAHCYQTTRHSSNPLLIQYVDYEFQGGDVRDYFKKDVLYLAEVLRRDKANYVKVLNILRSKYGLPKDKNTHDYRYKPAPTNVINNNHLLEIVKENIVEIAGLVLNYLKENGELKNIIKQTNTEDNKIDLHSPKDEELDPNLQEVETKAEVKTDDADDNIHVTKLRTLKTVLDVVTAGKTLVWNDDRMQFRDEDLTEQDISMPIILYIPKRVSQEEEDDVDDSDGYLSDDDFFDLIPVKPTQWVSYIYTRWSEKLFYSMVFKSCKEPKIPDHNCSHLFKNYKLLHAMPNVEIFEDHPLQLIWHFCDSMCLDIMTLMRFEALSPRTILRTVLDPYAYRHYIDDMGLFFDINYYPLTREGRYILHQLEELEKVFLEWIQEVPPPIALHVSYRESAEIRAKAYREKYLNHDLTVTEASYYDLIIKGNYE